MIFASLLIPVVQVSALEISESASVDTSGPRVKAEMKNKFMENRMELRAEVKTKMTELRDSVKEARTKNLEEEAKVRVVVKLDKIFDRLTNRLDRLTKIDAEITKRLSTRANTAPVVSLQVSAQTALAKAKVDVEAAKAAAVAEVKTTTSKEVLRNLVKTAEASIKTAGEEYKKVVEEMKDLPRATTNN